jgi:hypothetical protein
MHLKDFSLGLHEPEEDHYIPTKARPLDAPMKYESEFSDPSSTGDA